MSPCNLFVLPSRSPSRLLHLLTRSHTRLASIACSLDSDNIIRWAGHAAALLHIGSVAPHAASRDLLLIRIVDTFFLSRGCQRLTLQVSIAFAVRMRNVSARACESWPC